MLTTVRLPLPLRELGFPDPLQAGATALASGDPAWAWTPRAPRFAVADCAAAPGRARDGWGLDHVVLLVRDVDAAAAEMAAAGAPARLRIAVRGRPTAFFRVGPLLEVVESPVRNDALFGVALVTTTPLEVVALTLRSNGRDVSDPRPAIQPGRKILTVRDVEAGLAIMSPDTSTAAPT
jgi:hypothetical protein